MIARGFKSVIWVATVGAAALCCYMVSLRVATERGELTKVESEIIAAKRDIRSLRTELGTRGRLTQLERWNSDVLALSAPTSAQFVKDEITLARLERREPTIEDRSEAIHRASAEVPAVPGDAPKTGAAPRILPALAPAPAPAAPALVRRASYTPSPAAAEAKEKAAPAASKPRGAAIASPPAKPEQKAPPKPSKGEAVAAAAEKPAALAPTKAVAAERRQAAAPVDRKRAAPARSGAFSKAQGSEGH